MINLKIDHSNELCHYFLLTLCKWIHSVTTEVLHFNYAFTVNELIAQGVNRCFLILTLSHHVGYMTELSLLFLSFPPCFISQPVPFLCHDCSLADRYTHSFQQANTLGLQSALSMPGEMGAPIFTWLHFSRLGHSKLVKSIHVEQVLNLALGFHLMENAYIDPHLSRHWDSGKIWGW